jgi:aspartyl-tRNA(Asn)/glutamyl-tRNA(Gln) amidotransferase subunit C
MAEINEEELTKLAKLSQIACTEEEKKKLLNKLRSVVDYVEQLQSIDTEGVDPCYNVLETQRNLMRDDIPGEILSRELFLSNAPSHVGGMIRVPPVIKFTS